MLIRKFQKSNECCLILIDSPLLLTHSTLSYHTVLYCVYHSLIFTFIYFICFARQIALRAKLFCAPKLANQNHTIVEVL